MRYLLCFLIVLAPVAPAYAQDKSIEDVQSKEVEAGDRVPFDGTLIPTGDAEFLFAAINRMQAELKAYETLFPQMNKTLNTSIKVIEKRNNQVQQFNSRPTKGELISTGVQAAVGGFVTGVVATVVAAVVIAFK